MKYYCPRLRVNNTRTDSLEHVINLQQKTDEFGNCSLVLEKLELSLKNINIHRDIFDIPWQKLEINVQRGRGVGGRLLPQRWAFSYRSYMDIVKNLSYEQFGKTLSSSCVNTVRFCLHENAELAFITDLDETSYL